MQDKVPEDQRSQREEVMSMMIINVSNVAYQIKEKNKWFKIKFPLKKKKKNPEKNQWYFLGKAFFLIWKYA